MGGGSEVHQHWERPGGILSRGVSAADCSAQMPARRAIGQQGFEKAEVKSGWRQSGPGNQLYGLYCEKGIFLFFARVEALCVQVMHKSP